MNTTKERFTVESDTGKPRITFSYPKTPSWKAYGTGRAWIELIVEKNGSLSIHAEEIPETIRGGKEIFVTLPPKVVAALKTFL